MELVGCTLATLDGKRPARWLVGWSGNWFCARRKGCGCGPVGRRPWLVDAILAEFERHGYPLPPEAAARVVALERGIDERVEDLYG